MLLAELQRGSSTCIFLLEPCDAKPVEFQGSFACLLILHDDFVFYQGGGLVALSLIHTVQDRQ